MLRESSTPIQVVARDLCADFIMEEGANVSIKGALRYNPADPFAVEMTLSPGEDSVLWIFARDLLATGMKGPAGSGDVRIRPSRRKGRAVLTVSLFSPAGYADLELSKPTVAAFLADTYALVPVGRESESADWDAELRALLRAPNV